MKEKLEKLFLEQKLTPFEISEILRLDLKTIKDLLIKYKITNNPKDRKYEIIRKTPFSKEQEHLIFGLLLGHARINPSNKIIITAKDKNDILWIKRRLGKFINVIQNKDNLFSVSFSHHGLSFFKKKFYDNNKKVIKEELINHFNDLTLATFYLQCGKFNKSSIRFSTYRFNKEENERLQYILKMNFEIRSKVCEYEKFGKKYYYLSTNKRNSDILMNIIKPYIDEYECNIAADIKSGYMLEHPNASDDMKTSISNIGSADTDDQQGI